MADYEYRVRESDHSLLASLRKSLRGLTEEGDSRWRICGNSMLPALRAGTAIVVRHTRRGILPGAIIAYWVRGDLIVHRVVAIRLGPSGRVFLTKGDDNSRCDAPVPESQVLGRVVAVQPMSGTGNDDPHRSSAT